MYQIQQLTQDPLQTQNLILPDGTTIGFTINYYPQQYGWFITSLTYGSFTLTGARICVSPNLLRQWKNIIPFGLAVFTTEKREPTQQQDFSSGSFTMFILTAAEVLAYEEYLSGS